MRLKPLTVALCLTVLAGCAAAVDPASGPAETPAPTVTAQPTASPSPTPQPTSPPSPSPSPSPTPVPVPIRFTVHAVGDLMCHDTMAEAALDNNTGVYDMRPQFEFIKDTLAKADLRVGNLECPIGKPGEVPSGYPSFRAPHEMAEALRYAGFDAVGIANNHTLDKGRAGMIATLDALDEAGIAHVGGYRSPEERDIPVLLGTGEYLVALLSYTTFYGDATDRLGKDAEWAFGRIDEKRIARDIELARKAGADIVLANLHDGSEYVRQPGSSQKKNAKLLLELGADVVLGHHPHVLQPVEIVDITRRDGSSARGVIAYSLGNFVSAQSRQYTDTGCILSMTFEKDVLTGLTRLVDLELVTTFVQRGDPGNAYGFFKVHPLAEIIDSPPEDMRSSQRRRLRRAAEETRELMDPDVVRVNP